MFVKPQTIRGETVVNLTGGWGRRDVTKVVGRGEEHIHTEVSCLDESHTVYKTAAQFTDILLLSLLSSNPASPGGVLPNTPAVCMLVAQQVQGGDKNRQPVRGVLRREAGRSLALQCPWKYGATLENCQHSSRTSPTPCMDTNTKGPTFPL